MNFVIVTGATGFIGANLVKKLTELGHHVLGFDVETNLSLRPEIKSLLGDVCVYDFGGVLEKVNSNTSAVFHMGAISDTRCEDWGLLVKNNLEYSQNLWKACAQQHVPFFYASSAATYGDGSLGYSDEESGFSKLNPLNLYGRSKKEFDDWALMQKKVVAPAYWCGFKFFNVYGFGEAHKKDMTSVIYKAFHQIHASGVIQLFKSYKAGVDHGDQKRDFVWVGDVVAAMIDAWRLKIQNGIYNLGSGTARSFNDLAKTTVCAVGKKAKIEYIEMPEDLKSQYQYFTEAPMHKLRTQLVSLKLTPLEEGVAAYVQALQGFKT